MKDNLEKILESAKMAHLSVEEKASMRFSLLQHINKMPVPSPYWNMLNIFKIHYVPALLVLFVLLSGGTKYYEQHKSSPDLLVPALYNMEGENAGTFMTTEAQSDATIEAPTPTLMKMNQSAPENSNTRKGKTTENSGGTSNSMMLMQTNSADTAPSPTTVPANTSLVAPAPTVKIFMITEVALHSTKLSCYTVINGGVYDLTKWITEHPGGASAIIGLCGKDGTAAFMAQHGGQGDPARELASFQIGIIK